MRSVSTLILGLPKICGKACGQLVETLRDKCVKGNSFLHSVVQGLKNLGINLVVLPPLYTICVQNCSVIVGNFTSVRMGFYTVFTGPIKTTTN